MSAAPRVPGHPHDFGGQVLTLAPLALGDLEQLVDRINAIKADATRLNREDVTTSIDVIHASLRRNYPDMTREAAAQLVDLGNMAEVYGKVMGVSGLIRKPGDPEPGEARAPSTGASSTQN